MQRKYEAVMQHEDSFNAMEVSDSNDYNYKTSNGNPMKKSFLFAVSSCKFDCGCLSHVMVFFFGIIFARIMSFFTHEYTLRCDSIAYGFLNTPKGHDLIDDLTSIMVRDGQVSALSTMEQMMNEDDSINDACHETLHKLATNTWRHQKLVSTQQATTHEQYETMFLGEFIGTPEEERLRLCGAGYLHGIVERGLIDFASQENGGVLASGSTNMTLEEDWNRLESEVSWLGENICNKIKNDEESGTFSNRWECQHGLGHGTLQNRRQVYRRIALLEALNLCVKVDYVDTSTCQDGIWMEYWTEVGLTMDEDLDDPAKDPLAICAQLPEQLSSNFACPFYAATSYLIRHPRDYPRAMQDFCRESSKKDESYICIQGVGMLVAKQNKDSFIPLEEVCLLAPNVDAMKVCFSAGVIYMLNSFHTGGTIPSYMCKDLKYFGLNCLQFASDEIVTREIEP